MKRKFKTVCESLTIWGSIIKRIEGRLISGLSQSTLVKLAKCILIFYLGHFGTSVASFFTFLRWLCALNLVLTLLIVGLLVIPQVGLDSKNSSHTSFHG